MQSSLPSESDSSSSAQDIFLFCGTEIFNTMFAIGRHWTPSWSSSIHSIFQNTWRQIYF